MPPETIFMARDYKNEYAIRPITNDDFAATLEVYRQCEDFLALGPVAEASSGMVRADIEHSAAANGVFCGIWSRQKVQVGLLDFIPAMGPGVASLSLLMIALPYRHCGIGTAVIARLEAYLKTTYHTRLLASGVQINNPAGIGFWKKCGFIIADEAEDMGDGTVAYQMYKEI